jgi:Tol biopolymer transport system component
VALWATECCDGGVDHSPASREEFTYRRLLPTAAGKGEANLRRIQYLLLVTAALLLAGAQSRLGSEPAAEAAFPGGNGKIAYLGATPPPTIKSIQPDGSGVQTITGGLNAAWSPDGQRLAVVDYAANGPDLFDIWRVDASGGNRVPLVVKPTPDSSPSYSPDGTRIVFIRQHSLAGAGGIITASSSDGSDEKMIVATDAVHPNFTAPSFSPDGQHIVYADLEHIWKVKSDGTGTPELIFEITNDDRVMQPDVSPDGTKIVFVRAHSNTVLSDLWVVDMNGMNAHLLTLGPHGLAIWPSWAPDGTQIAFQGALASTPASCGVCVYPQGGNEGVYTAKADGTGTPKLIVAGHHPDWQRIPAPILSVEFTQGIQDWQTLAELQASLGAGTATVGGQSQPGASFDGTIAYRYDYGNVEDEGEAIYALTSSGSSEIWSRLYGGGPGYTGNIEWSRSRELAFRVDEAIFAVPEDGGATRQIVAGGEDAGFSNPSWSPDGDRLAVARGGEISVVSASSGSPMPGPNVQGSEPDWSPNGDKIVFVGGGGLSTTDLSGSDVDLLIAAPGGVSRPAWSPSGSKIAFASSGDIHVVNADGSALRNLTNSPGVQESDPEWSPDSGEIAYLAQPTGVIQRTIMVLDVETEATRLVHTPGGVGQAHAISWLAPPLIHGVEFTQGIQQLQSLSALVADVQGDGHPPVPLVAGKPAVMRIYFEEVTNQTSYTVDVSGAVSGSEPVQLDPGCTAEDRRKQLNSCKSVDFYFTPPQGSWSVTLKVRNSGGGEVENRTFNLKSEKSDALVLKAVSTCFSNLAGVYTCEDASELIALASKLRRIAPTHEVRVEDSGHVAVAAPAVAGTCPQTISWWANLAAQVHNLYGVFDQVAGVLGSEVFYHAMVDPSAPGCLGYASSIPSRGAASETSYMLNGQEEAPWVVAHETGHMMGLRHTNSAAPALSPSGGCWLGSDPASTWPYADNMLRSGSAPGTIEVGFDVAAGKALPGDKNFEVIGYCAPTWISPHSTNILLKTLDNPAATPASIGLAGDGESATGSFWMVAGTLGDGTVSLSPLFEMEATASTAVGDGSHRIEVRDGAESVLFTRKFEPVHAHGSPRAGDSVAESEPFFGEMIPVQPGAAFIVVLDGSDVELGRITLGGTAPSIDLTLPPVFTGDQTLSWEITDDGSDHTYAVLYSAGDVEEWTSLGMGLTENSLTVDFDSLAGGANARFRVLASDGVNTGVATSEPFVVGAKLPHAEIIGPAKTSFRQGNLVWLEAAAWDAEDGTLDGEVAWSSNKDGNLGSGASLPVYDLSVGTHTITMTATDSDDNAATDTITVTVSDTPLVEGGTERTWGDNNCSGSADPVDALLALRFDAGQETNTGECPEMGVVVEVAGASPHPWGDIDCTGDVGPVDGLKLLRFDSGLSVAQEPGCPAVGSVVSVDGLPRGG